jgi:hypothetical protein
MDQPCFPGHISDETPPRPRASLSLAFAKPSIALWLHKCGCQDLSGPALTQNGEMGVKGD